jgi:hypothetical protein
MLAARHIHDPAMRDLEQELATTIMHRRNPDGEPLDGLFNLTRRMENEDEDQFDVDLTILDFLVYKAIALVFEWRSGTDPYQSDLPNALVTMTGGRCQCLETGCHMLTLKTGGCSSHTSITAAGWVVQQLFDRGYYNFRLC